MTSTHLRHPSTLGVGFLFPISIHGIRGAVIQDHETQTEQKKCPGYDMQR
jgi:hypothetical protein